MKIVGQKIFKLLLIGLLMTVVLVPAAVAAAANQQVSLVFNSQEYEADMYIENDLSYISTASLTKIPGLAFEEEGYVPLRSFFESREGNVRWDNTDRKVIVSWREKNDDWTADELAVESNRLLQEENTYKMKGSATIEMNVTGPDADGIPEIPEMPVIMEGVFQQEPLSMYVKQTMALPLELSGEDLDLTEEEAALLPDGEMVTEMLWTENNIYQKTPLSDQWIVQDLFDADMMENLTGMLQTTPQQSLDMMREFGIIYIFGDDLEIDGQEYYTISNYIDSATCQKALSEFLGDFDMGSLMAGLEGATEGATVQDEEEIAEFKQVLEQLLTAMEMDYYVDTYVNKETLLTDRMKFNMEIKFELDETMSPEGAVSFEMAMFGDFELDDIGEEIQLPDVSGAITQQEFMEQMMDTMEIPEE
jgi:hypothetical protein